MPEREIITGLDIGTSKVCAIIGEVGESGQVNIIGVGTSPSHGLKKGMVVNLDKTVQAINAATRAAERMAGTRVSSVFVGVAGGHIVSFNSSGVVAVADSEEITHRDVMRVIEAAKVVAIPADRQIIHALPMEFIVDSCRGIKNPEGMAGKRLEVEVHIVTGRVTALQNIVKCVQRAGLEVRDLILQPLASCTSVLTPDEQECGTVLIDIGGGTTDLAVFYEGSVLHTAVLPVGGDHFTHDLAYGLRIPFAEGERLKLLYSSQGDTGNELPVDKLQSILYPRGEEVFQLVEKELAKLDQSGIAPIQCVLTGGASQLRGLTDIAEEVLGLPVRIGTPRAVGGLIDIINSPAYATGIGLVQYAAKQGLAGEETSVEGPGLLEQIIERITRWFKDFIPTE